MSAAQQMSLGLSFWLSVVALFVALFVGSQFVAQFLIYYLYRPYIFVTGKSPNFRNESSRRLSAEFEIFSDRGVNGDIKWPFSAEQMTLAESGGFKLRTVEIDLPSGAVSGPANLPFQVEKGDKLRFVIHPYIEASELGLPAFFGKIKLKPVRQEFVYGKDPFIDDLNEYPPADDLLNGINHKLQWWLISRMRELRRRIPLISN